jgi:hypothetical protein
MMEETFLILRPETNLTHNNCRPMAAFGRPFLFEVIFMYSNLLENLRLVGLGASPGILPISMGR